MTCPKRMTYGPCGGVREDLSCEMAAHRCVFVDEPPPVWVGELARPLEVVSPYVLTDLTVRPFDVENLRAVCEALRSSCDAVLVGEHQQRPDFPPAQMSALVRQAGLALWITLTCRDRNRVVLEQELAGLAQASAGPEGVLCVTGDGRAPGVRPEVSQVFDVDSTRLASLAAQQDLVVAVAEAPEAPPLSARPLRVLSKQRAGANVCFLNHVGTASHVGAFIEACRAVGVTLPFVAGVAVYTDERSARVLQAFPGLQLDEARVQEVLSATSPEVAGIRAAVAEATRLLQLPGVVGVNLSGLASARGEVQAARIKADVAEAIRAEAA